MALASAARVALSALPDAKAPAAIGGPAVAAAQRSSAERAEGRVAPGGRPGWYRWAGVAAGIAAAIALLAVVLPRVGPQPSGTLAAAASAARSAAEAPASRVEAQRVDYDLAGVQTIANSYGGGQDSAFAAASTAAPAPEGGGAHPLAATSFDAAVGCLDRAFSPQGQTAPEGQLVRVIEARYQGTPAYLGVYLIGPGAGQPADVVRVLVASRSACTILTSSQATL